MTQQTGYGSITLTNIATITGVDIYYAKNSDPVNPPTSDWNTDAPQWENGKHIWQKTVTTYDNNSQEVSDPVCITGEKGANGKSVVSIKEQFYLSTSSSSPENGSWLDNQPAYVANHYYFVRSEIVWANPTETTYAPSVNGVLAGGLNSANEKANSADGKAGSALSLATSADSKADAAQTSANSKNTIFYGTTTPTANKNNDVWFKDDGNGNYSIRYWNSSTSSWSNTPLDGTLVLKDASITNAKIYNLDGNKITANSISTNQLATDAIKSTNYVAPSGTSPYSTAGTFLDLSNGNIYSKNFGVNGSNGNVYVSGNITATSGTIGNTSNNNITISADSTNAAIYSKSHSSLASTGDGFYIGSDGISIGSKLKYTGGVNDSLTVDSITATNFSFNSGTISGSVSIGGVSGDNINQNITNASYSVEIQVTSINYTENTATLVAVPYHHGSIPTGVTLHYTWYQDSTSNTSIGTDSNTLNVTALMGGLNHSYICVISTT